MRFSRLALLAAFVAFASPGVSTQALANPAEVKAIIEAQLEAFRSGKPEAAYELAAPSIKRMFPTVDRFVTMVRRGYAPVYQGGAPVFMRSRAIGEDEYAQEVGLTDNDGKAWTALYILAKQDDGSWLITGCYLKAAEGQNI
jgi:hypothetical protein